MHQTLNQQCIADLVNAFYGKIPGDQLLGPIFGSAIGSDWGPHLEKMNAFWTSVLLASGTYKGNPMIAHLRLPRLTQPHFERWLELWRETASSLCSPAVAALLIQKAEMIAERFLHAISTFHETVGQQLAVYPRPTL
jgi:hemoglobin